MFVTTANTLRMPQPLLDRMEVIRIPGYTEDEKVEIASATCCQAGEGAWPEEGRVVDLGRCAARHHPLLHAEAGVRNLEREIANLARKSIKEILMKNLKKIVLSRRNLEKFAGVRRYRFGEAELEDMVGVTTGLAWTEVGGEILTIEAVTVPRQGQGDGNRPSLATS